MERPPGMGRPPGVGGPWVARWRLAWRAGRAGPGRPWDRSQPHLIPAARAVAPGGAAGRGASGTRPVCLGRVVTVLEALALIAAGVVAGVFSTVVGLASVVSYPALLAIEIGRAHV